MGPTLRSFPFVAIAIVLASCAEPEKPPSAATNAKAALAGTSFNQVGKVAFYAGQPCTSQIMFIFRAGKSTVSLAAPMRETKTLTEAAKRERRVRVFGKWRRSKQAGCTYVEVTQAEVQKSLW